MRLTFAAVLIAAVTAFMLPTATAAAPPPDGQMTVTAPAVVADGATFTVDVEVAAAPAGGYVGFQARLQWESTLSYLPSALLADEVVGPHCIPARTIMGATDALFACFTIPLPPAPFTDTGPMLRLTFTCHAPGGALTLTTGGPLDSAFVDAGLNQVPMLLEAGAIVLCPPSDVDGDGCPDAQETALGLDPNDPLDWPDLDHSGAIDAADIALAVQVFGQANVSIDRTGDGVVSVGDVVRVVAQFGRTCG